MTSFLLHCETKTWEKFKEVIPRDLTLETAINLIISHHISMGESGKVMLNILKEKHDVDKKEIRAKYIKIKEKYLET